MNLFLVTLFAILGIIWGSNFIYMKMAAVYIDPMQVVFYRVLFGFIPVFLYAIYKNTIKLEHLKYSFHFFIMSLFAAVIYYYGFVKGSSLLLSGIAGALSGSVPLFSFLVASIFLKEEKITKLASIGVIVGFIGIILISGVINEDIEGSNLEGILAIVIGSLSVGASFIYAKKFITPLKIKAAALVTYQLGFALIILLLITDLEGINYIWNDFHSAIGMVLGLGLLGTGVAFIGYYYLIEKLGALKASSITYIPPVVALFIGFFIVGENIKLLDFIATAFIFIGVFLINKRKA
ncbi:DMT family transporter [Poseidonibacter sp. 1_MG-2023]|uniref:DMT family transporter n=1 Tax=Poseidonibacter TaxID=2321187 RepID=UPI0026E4500D|nr:MULTISPECIES: DMT family transporter [Poseidonibacter]MDO6828525.1 DMT family transporter [Poseidonibacter sp. 1_MG-2023]